MRLLKLQMIEIIVCAFLFMLPMMVFGQLPNHTYPRIAIWQWAGAVPDWYARFDLAMTRISDRPFIDQVKRINSQITWLPTQDFNTAYDHLPNFPEQWYLVDSKGSRAGFGNPAVDLSDLGVRVNGERFIDFYPKYLAKLVADGGADGMATDGLYSRGHLSYYMWEDVDLDRNGVNDLTEHGKTWVINHWANGVEFLLAELRSKLGDGKYILINSGSGDTPGLSVANGYVHEYDSSPEVGSWDGETYWRGVMAKVRQPPIFLQESNPDPKDPQEAGAPKNYLRFMRFSLAKAMLVGRYYGFEHYAPGSSPDHYWNKYFDEFDLDVGHPKGGMQRIKDAVWARIFDKGVAIANFAPRAVTVTDQDLRTLAGYNGPYFRFLGGQDMAQNGSNAMNNGQQFTSVTFQGHSYIGWRDAEYVVGDGIILVKTSQTIVSDLIIDNTDMGTSPTNDIPNFTGGMTQQDCDAGTDFYEIRCSWNPGSYSFAIAPSGSGEAIYTLNIGVAGRYEVFEWHGRVKSGALASNAKYIITHVGDKTTKIVNQQVNTGQWNSLGVYTFAKGTSQHITISSAGANGPVMADAIKLVFRDGNSKSDTSAPAPPQKVRVEPGN